MWYTSSGQFTLGEPGGGGITLLPLLPFSSFFPDAMSIVYFMVLHEFKTIELLVWMGLMGLDWRSLRDRGRKCFSFSFPPVVHRWYYLGITWKSMRCETGLDISYFLVVNHFPFFSSIFQPLLFLPAALVARWPVAWNRILKGGLHDDIVKCYIFFPFPVFASGL
jgi:hypothetical protein